MVMSGSAERIVFVHGRFGDESWLTGGVIARLNHEGSRCLVLFAADAGGEDAAAVAAALAELGAVSWHRLPAGPGAAATAEDAWLPVEEALADAFAAEWATAVVIGDLADDLRAAVLRAANSAGLSVFASRRVSDATMQRLVAIDVSDRIDQKLRALSHYPQRFTGHDRSVTLPDGTERAVSGTEAFARLEASPREPSAVVPPPGLLNRALAGLLGLVAGIMFGVLGTLAHQATMTVGSVPVPVGLGLALVAVGALLVGLRLVLGGRTVALLAATGLLVSIFVLSLRGVGGSVLVPAGLTGTLWTVVPTLLAALVLAWPKIPTRR